MPRGVDEHQVKKRSFAFSLAYIKCFRTYSVYLSLRLPAQILYAGIHLPPQREARARPRRAQSLPRRKPQLSPPLAGCPHPSRCGAAPLRATFPKGKAKRPLTVLNSCSNKKSRAQKNQFEHGTFKRKIRLDFFRWRRQTGAGGGLQYQG